MQIKDRSGWRSENFLTVSLFKQGEIFAFFEPVPDEDILTRGLPGARIDKVFSNFSMGYKDTGGWAFNSSPF